jgi:hypothetical protein
MHIRPLCHVSGNLLSLSPDHDEEMEYILRGDKRQRIEAAKQCTACVESQGLKDQERLHELREHYKNVLSPSRPCVRSDIIAARRAAS